MTVTESKKPAVNTLPVVAPLPLRWSVRPPAPVAAVRELMRALGLPATLAGVLYSRGIHSFDALEPPLELNPNPALPEAAKIIVRAIQNKKRIRVHGDYDADGVTASSILLLGLKALGADVHAFIPDRLHEGYGIHPDKVPEHIEACDLFITVDCGVSNLDEVAKLVEAGLEVIVTDHHAPGRELPGCLIVHPKLAPNYHDDLPVLAGAGVAFHLLWAVHDAFGKPPPFEYADLAAIGTIADVAPLLGENRAIAKLGIERLRDSRHVGLRVLVAQHNLKDINARSVAFVIAPRINAAGRLGEAGAALELLTTSNERRAVELALFLEARNEDRRRIEREMLAEAIEIVDLDAPAIVITKAGWHPGVMGIVAARLLERFYKPVFIVAEGKGSVRSTPGISAVEALRFSAQHLKRFGGHTAAAGFAMKPENFEVLRQSICEFVAQHPRPMPTVLMDGPLDFSEAQSLFEASLSLEPFGEGNRKPVFLLRGPIDAPGAMGKERNHYQYRVGNLRGRQWNAGYGFAAGDVVDAAVGLELNTWQGRSSLELDTSAMRYAAPLRVESADPLRVETADPFSQDANHDAPQAVRISPQEAVAQLKTENTAVFAENEVLEYLQRQIPDLQQEILSSKSLILFSLPAPDVLHNLLQQNTALVFALGEKTLAALETKHFYTWPQLQKLCAELRFHDVPKAAETLVKDLQAGKIDATQAHKHEWLIEQEAEAYRLRQFCFYYRHADAAGFAAALRALYL